MTQQKAMTEEDRYDERLDASLVERDAAAAEQAAQSMEDVYREELHTMFVRKDGICHHCGKPIASEADATITHIVTAHGNRPVLTHKHEMLAVSLSMATAQGFIKPLRKMPARNVA